MRRIVITVVSAGFVALLCGNALAFQSGKIYVSKEGEWMCIDRWGNEIPASASGGWTVVSPPRQVGGGCNNQRVVLTGTTLSSSSAVDLVAPLPGTPLTGATKGINEAGIK